MLLKDYTPDSSLVVPAHVVPKAKYPVIDVHTHPTMQGNVTTPAAVATWLKTMDEVGIATSVVFTGATGAEFDRLADLFRPYGNRFQVYCSLDTTNIDAPDYPQRAARELERCYRKGARGTGELVDKGWGIMRNETQPMPRAKRMHPDDPRLDPFWEKCAELKIPVNIHVADHPSCWEPLGPHQERTSFYQKFNLYGKDVPSFQELIGHRDRMLARHPRTTFIACHLATRVTIWLFWRKSWSGIPIFIWTFPDGLTRWGESRGPRRSFSHATKTASCSALMRASQNRCIKAGGGCWKRRMNSSPGGPGGDSTVCNCRMKHWPPFTMEPRRGS